MSAFRIVGILLTVLGALAAVFPGWFEPLTGGPEPAADTFAAIERRIRGGMVLGLGLVFLARTTLRPWSVTIPSVLFYVLLGALLARVLGLVIEGDEPRQWSYVALEGVLIALAAAWLWRSSTSG